MLSSYLAEKHMSYLTYLIKNCAWIITWFFTNKNKPYSSVLMTLIISYNLLVVWTYFEQDSVILSRFSEVVEFGNLYVFILKCKEQFLVFGSKDAKCDKLLEKMPKFHELCNHILLVTMTLFTKSTAISEYQNKNHSRKIFWKFCQNKWI